MIVALAAGGCGDGAAGTSSLGTTAPSQTPKSETFSGVVPIGGIDVHDFTIAVAGQVTVTLTDASPAVSMGLGVGSRNGSACDYFQNLTAITAPGSAAQLTGNLQPGNYCVAVNDTGNAPSPVSYTVIVTHT
jgi:hypothetical protein